MHYGLTQYADSPTLSVVSLADAKLHLRVDFNDDDSLINSLIDAATLQAEAYCNKAFTPRNYLMTLGAWPAIGAGSFGPGEDYIEFPARFGGSGRPSRYPDAICLPVAPVSAVTSITYLESTAGAVTTLSSSTYVVVTSTAVPMIVPATGQVWPTLYDHPEAVRIAFRAGYEADVPANVVAAVKLLVGHWYDTRADVNIGNIVNVIPKTSQYLLNPHRMFPL